MALARAFDPADVSASLTNLLVLFSSEYGVFASTTGPLVVSLALPEQVRYVQNRPTGTDLPKTWAAQGRIVTTGAAGRTTNLKVLVATSGGTLKPPVITFV